MEKTGNTGRASFAAAYGRLEKLATAHPAFFDFANRVVKKVDSGESLWLGAIIEGLLEAHQMGLEGRYPEEDPVLKAHRAGKSVQAESKPQRILRSRA